MLEEILKKNPTIDYPIYISGKRACPPEDCGGVRGYYKLLKSIKNHNHKHKLELTGGAYDPEGLNVQKIKFENPDIRLDLVFNR
jgi:hypothetical protein